MVSYHQHISIEAGVGVTPKQLRELNDVFRSVSEHISNQKIPLPITIKVQDAGLEAQERSK